MNALQKLDNEIFQTTARLEELKSARKIMIEMDPNLEYSEPPWPNKDFLGANIWEWCGLILSKREKAHYRDMANEAIQRGYHNRRGSSVESIQRSFLDTMRRDDDFVACGDGYFQFKNHKEQSKPYERFFKKKA